jgi:polyisoprenoid-binding protein YceI
MKKFVLSALVMLTFALASAPQLLRAENYALDTAHTSVIFGISHMGFSYTYGRFNKVAGKYALDEANPAASSFELTIDASSIDTNDAKRDEHLRGADFLSSNEFPTLAFKSTEVVGKKNDKDEMVLDVTGDLTMHGVTRKVTLPLRVLKVGISPMDNKKHSGFLCEVKLLRSEFGMTKMIPGVGDEVAVTISFEGVAE